jgi:cell division protein FtsI (penicillin-binding protein 3)
MGSSTNKGNISGLLFTLSWICLMIIGIFVARLMLGSSSAGKYDNPKVAQTVIGGTIYDKNKRILAMDVPQYDVYVDPTYSDLDLLAQVLSLHLNMSPDDILSKITSSQDSMVLLAQDLSEATLESLKTSLSSNSLEVYVYIKKIYRRTYPAQFHASQLISAIEKNYEDILFPQAEYDTNTTYGKNLVLTLDLDVQYLLDLAVQNVYELQSPDYVVAQIVDLSNDEVLAASYYPFSDLNSTTSASTKSYLIGNFYYEGTTVEDVLIIQEVQNHAESQEAQSQSSLDQSKLYNSFDSIDDNLSSTIALIGNESTDSARYLIYIGSCAPKYYKDSTVLEDAILSIEEGLKAQNKL